MIYIECDGPECRIASQLWSVERALGKHGLPSIDPPRPALLLPEQDYCIPCHRVLDAAVSSIAAIDEAIRRLRNWGTSP